MSQALTKSRMTTSTDTLALREAMCALPPGQREAIELIKLRGLSIKEAAAATGSTVGALKVATHRAVGDSRSFRRGLQIRETPNA